MHCCNWDEELLRSEYLRCACEAMATVVVASEVGIVISVMLPIDCVVGPPVEPYFVSLLVLFFVLVVVLDLVLTELCLCSSQDGFLVL